MGSVNEQKSCFGALFEQKVLNRSGQSRKEGYAL